MPSEEEAPAAPAAEPAATATTETPSAPAEGESKAEEGAAEPVASAVPPAEPDAEMSAADAPEEVETAVTAATDVAEAAVDDKPAAPPAEGVEAAAADAATEPAAKDIAVPDAEMTPAATDEKPPEPSTAEAASKADGDTAGAGTPAPPSIATSTEAPASQPASECASPAHRGSVTPSATPTVEEVIQLRGILEAAPLGEKQATLDALATLRSFGPLPVKIVKETNIGLAVNVLSKSATLDQTITDRAKELLDEWRQAHRRKRAASSSSLAGPEVPLKRLNSNLSERGDGLSQLSQLSQDSLAGASEPDASPMSAVPEGKKTADLRNKVRQKLIEAMGKEEEIENKDSKDGNEEMRDPAVLATEIEEALYIQLLKARGEKDYNNQARSVIHNLKDKKNPTFRFKLIVGFYKPESIPTLSAEEMASDTKNAERAKIRQDAAEAIQSDWAIRHGAARICGMFTCGKCKGTRTTYFQMQTRSSDEPMTTFVTCLTCGNRWKFC